MASEMPTARIQPMDFGEILDTAIRVFKSGWKPLLLIGLLSSVPWIIYNALSILLMPTRFSEDMLVSNPFFRAVMAADNGDWEQMLGLAGYFALVGLFMALLFPWLKGALIIISSRLYLGLPVTVGMGLRLAGRRYFALLGTGLLVLAGSVAAIIGLTIAGLLFLAWLTVPVGLGVLWVWIIFNRHAMLIESAGGGMPAIRRSFGLVNGRFWPLLGLGIVFYLFTATLAGQIAIISQIPAQLVLTYTTNESLVPVLSWVVAAVSGLLQGLVAPLYAVGLTLAYYDTRMRKEGLDIEMMAAKQVGQ
ncbi:MAG TPA: hypothetical protein VD969_18485 [Symbiobacteriaceae bacterium]|nr:hypothetical protein [Symbiobacteriaceae bacterium]